VTAPGEPAGQREPAGAREPGSAAPGDPAGPAAGLAGTAGAELDALLARADASLADRYPGDRPGRQPVHTVYVPADQFEPGLPARWGGAAQAALAQHLPGRADFADVMGLPPGLTGAVRDRVAAKLAAEPVEDLRLDFEDGYGDRAAAAEDGDARAAARALAGAVAAGTAPPFTGLRCKSLEPGTRRRAIATLDIFLGELTAGGRPLPPGLVITLPKVTSADQVRAMVVLCERLEQAHRVPDGQLRFEVQAETSQIILGADGAATIARCVHAGGARLTGLHYGTYDYSAALGIAADYQSMEHPAADHARAVLQVAAAGTGVRLSDGSSNVLPVGGREEVRAAWRLHARLVRRSLERGFYQGWDLHPAQLVSRYAATYGFFRAGLPGACTRLAGYAGRVAGGVLEEPATARALAGYLIRGLDCGATGDAEVTAGCGLDRGALDALAATGRLPRPAATTISPTTISPITASAGATAAGPAATDPATAGPAATDPATAGPAATDPAISSPAATNPATPAAANPGSITHPAGPAGASGPRAAAAAAERGLVIRGRRVVTPDGMRAATVVVTGGVITSVGPYDRAPDDAARPDAQVIELAEDEVLLPGLVDTHVHVNEPGRTSWEGYATATRAAAAGGITTIIDMPLNSIPPTTDAAALAAKRAVAASQIQVDTGFWGGAVPGNEARRARLHEAGVFGFKCFLLDSGVPEFPPLGEAQLEQAARQVAGLGSLLIVHAEDPAAIRAARQGDKPGGPEYASFLRSRPDEAETAAVARVLAVARRTGARMHILHLSSAGCLPLLAAARRDGLPVTVETCPHYLALAAEDVPDGATAFKCCPPIRGRANADQLWNALAEGIIDCVVSDHSPCPPELKDVAGGDFSAAWGGISSLQLTLPVVWTAARARGYALADVTRWMSARTAAIAGLAAKGAIAPGRDADLVVLAPDESFTVDPARLQHRHPVTPYAGRRLDGVVRRTWLRGIPVPGDEPAGHLLERP
jgi:allantoinase